MSEYREDVVRFKRVSSANCFCRFQRAPSFKNGELPEQDFFFRREQLVAPIQGSTQGLMTRQRGAPTAGEKIEAVIQTRRNLFYTQHPDPHRGEFNGEWDSIQAFAYLRNGRRILFGE